MTDVENLVWNEKYRPKEIDDFLLPDDIKDLIKSYVEQQEVDNLFLYGSTGVGKTSIVKYLINNIDCEVLSINASEERGIDTIREKVVSFAVGRSFSPLKIVDFREGEKLTPDAQDALKDIIEESYDDTKYIFTTNNISKIISPIRGRGTEVEVVPSDVESVGKRMAKIIENEGFSMTGSEKKKLWKFIKRKYPNIRQIINTIQTSFRSGEFNLIESKSYTDEFDEIIDIVSNTTSKNLEDSYKSVRSIINSIPVTFVDEMYSYLYNHILEMGFTKSQELEVIDIISTHNYQHGLVVDIEINISAMLVKLLKLKTK